MSGFLSSETQNIVVLIGDPDCQSAHDYILRGLNAGSHTFLSVGSPVNDIIRGNLGEFIAFITARELRFLLPPYAFAANASKPISTVSRPDIDIIWLLLGDTEPDDLVVVQEVKTTGDPSLGYAFELIADYEKLFGIDVYLTLRTRLDDIKNKLEFEWKRPDLARRLTKLAGVDPSTSPKVLLLPSLVHERTGADPVARMTSVRQAILSKGWDPRNVTGWSVGLTDLNDRLRRLASGSS